MPSLLPELLWKFSNGWEYVQLLLRSLLSLYTALYDVLAHESRGLRSGSQGAFPSSPSQPPDRRAGHSTIIPLPPQHLGKSRDFTPIPKTCRSLSGASKKCALQAL